MRCRATSAPIDDIKTDCAILSFYEDERPLKGMTGLVDWRLCGSLSRFILDGNIDGHFGEILMFPERKWKLQADRVLLIGLGPKSQFSFETYSVTIRRILDSIFKLNINDFVLELPGLIGTDLDISLAATRFVEALAIRYREEQSLLAKLSVTIMAVSDQLKKLNPVFGKFEKNTRLDLGLE